MELLTARISSEYVAAAREALERDVLSASGKLQNNGVTRRERYEFGYDFDELRKGDYTFREIPEYLTRLGEQALAALGNVNTGEPLPNIAEFRNYILSWYGAGYCLQPHVDATAEAAREKDRNFYFGSVVGIVLDPDKKGKLYYYGASGTKHELLEEEGTVFALHDPTRNVKHGVSKVAQQRLSLTLRTVEFF